MYRRIRRRRKRRREGETREREREKIEKYACVSEKREDRAPARVNNNIILNCFSFLECEREIERGVRA